MLYYYYCYSSIGTLRFIILYFYLFLFRVRFIIIFTVVRAADIWKQLHRGDAHISVVPRLHRSSRCTWDVTKNPSEMKETSRFLHEPVVEKTKTNIIAI